MSFSNDFSWSAKRNKIFKTCKRKFYYDCYGFFNGWSFGSPDNVKEIYLLKKLKSIPFWIGGLVREKIREILLGYYSGKEINIEEALQVLEGEFKANFRQSEEKLYKKDPKGYLALREHEYGLNVTEEELKEKLEFAKTCIKNFYEYELFKEIKESNLDSWILRKSGYFPSFDFEDTKVFCMYDLAILEEGNLTIFDWTTGSETDEEEELWDKKNVLLLYFSKKQKLPYDKIVAKKIFLKNNSVKTTTFNSTSILKMENYVRKSISEMKTLLDDQTANTATESNFEKTDNVSDCTFCNYKKHCFPNSVSEFKGY